MSIFTEGERSFFLTDRVVLLDNDRETAAWAEDQVVDNPAFAWVLGKFAEAERENANRHWWSTADLAASHKTIAGSPLNINHRPREVVGHFVDSRMLYNTDGEEGTPPLKSGAAASVGQDVQDPHPYIEALGVVWKYYFPVEYAMIREASQEGSLAYSMECVADTVTCAGDGGCEKTFAYKGPKSDTYCAHLNAGESRKQMNKPHFVGGALILPPAKPAWREAKVKDLAGFQEENKAEAEAVYAAIENEFPHLDSATWESMMSLLIQQPSEARQFSSEERTRLAQNGQAMPDGSYPIVNEADLHNAIQAFGRSSNPEATKKHIIKRAKALGRTDLLPDSWS